MIQVLRDQKLKSLQKELLDGINTVERRADIKVRNHLAFGDDANANIQFLKNDGEYFIGNRHGRGIRITPGGYIHIGYFNNGVHAPGYYITIYSDGRFDVGKMYLKDGQLRDRGTRYYGNGVVEKFDD